MELNDYLDEYPWFRGIGVEHEGGLGIQNGPLEVLKGWVIVGVNGGLPVSGWLWKDKCTDLAGWRSIGIGIRHDSRLFD